ncbi:MAG: Gfo/Idh/MocA family oxidoreductase [Phycisphaerales bacterium]|nr:Gfo/Idh/MocA family oxidoreductase [Phycisphaerales bacterium]
MSGNVYRAGCIGLGNIFRDRHQVALEALPGWAISKVYDVSAEAVARAKERSPGAAVARSPEEILDDPDIDAVVICTPPHVRRDFVIRAAANGKHLMLEKPIARKLDDARAMVAAIEKAGVACFVPFTRTFWPGERKCIEWARSGRLGKPVSFVHNSITPPYAYKEGEYAWMNDRDGSGGPMFDYSIHFLDFALKVFETPPTAVWRHSKHYSPRTIRCEDVCTMIVEFGDQGAATFIKVSAVRPDAGFWHETCHITCEHGQITMPNGYSAEWCMGGDGEKFASESKPEIWSKERFGAFTELANCIRAGRECGGSAGRPCSSNERDGLRTIEVLEAGFRSESLARRVLLTEV